MNNSEELNKRITSLEAKLLDWKKRLEDASHTIEKAKASDINTCMFLDSFTTMEEQYKQAENELVELFKQRQSSPQSSEAVQLRAYLNRPAARKAIMEQAR